MDDRAAITALVQAARRLSQRDGRPAGDVYFVFTTNEEIGGVGGSYASRTLPGDFTLAVEVGPPSPSTIRPAAAARSLPTATHGASTTRTSPTP